MSQHYRYHPVRTRGSPWLRKVTNSPGPDPRQVLATQRARIETWLEQDQRLTLARVHESLGRDGIAVSYTTLASLGASGARLARARTNGARRRSMDGILVSTNENASIGRSRPT